MTILISRQETKTLYPNMFKHGVIALVVTQRGDSFYQHFERADGRKTKSVRIPAQLLASA